MNKTHQYPDRHLPPTCLPLWTCDSRFTARLPPARQLATLRIIVAAIKHFAQSMAQSIVHILHGWARNSAL